MTVEVHHESSKLDEKTGEPFRWRTGFDDLASAKKHMRQIARGTKRDPFGRPWPNVVAWIETSEATP